MIFRKANTKAVFPNAKAKVNFRKANTKVVFPQAKAKAFNPQRIVGCGQRN